MSKSRLRDDWRRWRRGARIHPGWTPVCFFSGVAAAMMRDLRLGLLIGLTLSLFVVTSCMAVYRANYAGEDDDMGGTKPSDPDDGAGDEE